LESTNIFFLDVDSGEAHAIRVTEEDDDYAQFSPDGNWIAYESDETGRPEVYVQAYPDLGHKIRVSRNGGQTPVWSRDGRELYFASGITPMGVKILAVSIDLGPPLIAGAPLELFETSTFLGRFDVCPDGRFVIIQFPEALPRVQGIDVAVGWTQTLPQLVPQ